MARVDIRELVGAIAERLASVGPDEHPKDVRRRLEDLRSQYPGMAIEVCGRRDDDSRAFQFHVLVSDPGQGTFCLTHAPSDDRPWALLGAQRWKEGELLVANGKTFTVRDAAVMLDFMWKDGRVCRDSVSACLLQRELELEGNDVTPSEVESFVEELRRKHGLYSAKSFEAWLSVRGLTLEHFMCEAREHAAMVALRRRKTRGAESYFEQRQRAFDVVELARCSFATEEEARAAKVSIDAGQTSFWALACARLAAAAEAPPRRRAGLVPSFQVHWRRDLAEASAAVIFAAQPGSVVGPLPWDQTFDLVAVIRRSPARLDQATRAAIEDTLFDAWLSETCSSARIEWNWGGPGDAAPAAPSS